MSFPDAIVHTGQDWQSQLRDVITSRSALLAELGLAGRLRGFPD